MTTLAAPAHDSLNLPTQHQYQRGQSSSHRNKIVYSHVTSNSSKKRDHSFNSATGGPHFAS